MPAGRAPRRRVAQPGARHLLQPAQEGSLTSLPELPGDISPDATAAYIRRVLDDELPVPAPIARQAALILQELRPMPQAQETVQAT